MLKKTTGGHNMSYNLERFITAQKRDYGIALQEIQSGYKKSHWMWYIFPQIAGLGFSSMAKMYEIQNLDEAKAYMENEYLRSNLIEISKALLECKSDDIEAIMGYPDYLKLCSCMTLFEKVAPEEEVFSQVIERFYGGKRDQSTLDILSLQ